jgi:hypothetical protein
LGTGLGFEVVDTPKFGDAVGTGTLFGLDVTSSIESALKFVTNVCPSAVSKNA